MMIEEAPTALAGRLRASMVCVGLAWAAAGCTPFVAPPQAGPSATAGSPAPPPTTLGTETGSGTGTPSASTPASAASPTPIPTATQTPRIEAGLLVSEYLRGSWLWEAESGRFIRLGGGDYQATSPVWSPDGGRVAYIATAVAGEVASEIRVYSLADQRERVLPGTRIELPATPGPQDTLRQLTWSGDGRWLLYLRQGNAVVYDLLAEQRQEYRVSDLAPTLGVDDVMVNFGFGIGGVSGQAGEFLLTAYAADDRPVFFRGSFAAPGQFEVLRPPAGFAHSGKITFWPFRQLAWPGDGGRLYLLDVTIDRSFLWAYDFAAASWQPVFETPPLARPELPNYQYLSMTDDGAWAAIYSISRGSELSPGRVRLVFVPLREAEAGASRYITREIAGVGPGGWLQQNGDWYFTGWLHEPSPGLYLISPSSEGTIIGVLEQDAILAGLGITDTTGLWRKNLSIRGWQPR